MWNVAQYAALQHKLISRSVVVKRELNVNKNPNPIIIKKYGNRRLYNTSESRYVNLDEVALMIRDGLDVQVVDANTNEDLTRLILAQIIVENAKVPESGFPLDMLRQMVMASGKLTQESVLNYTKTMLDMYRNAYRAFSPPLTPFDLFQSMVSSPGRSTQPPPSPPSASSPEENPASAPTEVRELLRRIEELEKAVANKAGTANKKSRRKTE
jgi:polyhydroxyalkanoate synthesis repressor PhaR